MTDTILDLFPSQSAGKFGRRQKRERGSRLPVTIVTGFLGAGKTTLVRRFLDTPEGKGTALIVNEFGSEGIDDALLRESSDEVTLLGNGCLCCNTRTDLQNTLRRLVADRDRGKIPHFGRVLIETSGLADMRPILQTFSTDRALGGEFAIEVVLTVVDAVSGLKNLEKAPEARKQAILADRIVISKTDIADAKAVKKLTAMLEDLNPRAAIDVAVKGDIDPKALTDTGQTDAIERHSGFVAEASHSRRHRQLRHARRDAADLAGVPARDGDADRAARPRPSPHQGTAQSRRFQGSGGVPGGATPDPSAGGTRGLARQGSRQPRGVHHARGERTAGR